MTSSPSSGASSSTTPTAAFRPVVGLLWLLLSRCPRGAAAIGTLPGPYPPFDACGCSFCPEGMVMGNRAGNFIIPKEFRDAFLGVSEMLCATIASLAQNGDLVPALGDDDFRLLDAYRTTCGCPRVADALGQQGDDVTAAPTAATTPPPQQLDATIAAPLLPTAVVSSGDFIKCDLCGDGQEVGNLAGAYNVPVELQDILGAEVPCSVAPVLKLVGVVGPFANLCSTDLFLRANDTSYRDAFRVACQCTALAQPQPTIQRPVTVSRVPATAPSFNSIAPTRSAIATLFDIPSSPSSSSMKHKQKQGRRGADDDTVDDAKEKDQKGDIFNRANNNSKPLKGNATMNVKKKRAAPDKDDDGYYTGDGVNDGLTDVFADHNDNNNATSNQAAVAANDDDDHIQDREKSERDDDDDDESASMDDKGNRRKSDVRRDGTATGNATMTATDEPAVAGTITALINGNNNNKRVRSSQKVQFTP